MLKMNDDDSGGSPAELSATQKLIPVAAAWELHVLC